ncbi:MAG: ABC transporter permease [Acidimicrobiales bacterium]
MNATGAAVAGPPPTDAGLALAAARRTTLTGTWSLVRFILRRDRQRLPVWIAGITLLVLSTGASIEGLYPTQADLDKAAQTAQENAALIALNAPAYGLDTLGGQTVFNVGSFGYVVMALMGMFLVGRHTRADEENGRTELLRATVLGRNAPVTAVLVVAAAAFAALGGLITLSMLSQDLPTAGSVLYGAAMGGFGLLFACVTAVTVQVTEHNRAALGFAGVVLGAAYVVRAVGDVGDGTLSWASPMGWAQAARPYAGERWWTLLLLAGAAIICVALAFALQGVRDLGSGLVPPRPGPPVASAALVGSAYGLPFRLQRASLIAWTLGLGLTGVSYGSVGQDVRDLIGDNDAFEDIIAPGGGSLTDAFFTTSLLMLALIAGGFAISSTLRLRSEEAGGRAEPLLATGLGRARWVTSYLAVALGGSAVLMAAAGFGMGLTYGVAVSDLGQLGRLLGAAVAFVPALWVLVGVTLVLFGWAPWATAAAWAVLVACFVVGLFAELLDLPSWVVDVSPFQHVPAMPSEGFALTPIVALTAIAAVLMAAGVAGFRRRDAGY